MGLNSRPPSHSILRALLQVSPGCPYTLHLLAGEDDEKNNHDYHGNDHYPHVVRSCNEGDGGVDDDADLHGID